MQNKAFEASCSELLSGINLIEASAGTGKTHAIAILVLRFVVELDVDLKELLVVTFTKAATEELKDRIRMRLVEAKAAVSQTEINKEGYLEKWLTGLTIDQDTIRRRLELALLDIDQAAIFTIHGFCQRVLSEHALECGQLFNCELSGDITRIRQNCADDFWRKHVYQRPVWQVSLLTAEFPTPDSLLSSINTIGLHQIVYPENDDLDTVMQKLEVLLVDANEKFPPLLQKLQAAFSAGFFKESFSHYVEENSNALGTWLQNPNTEKADFLWLTAAGLLDGLNGRKFLVSKNKPLPSEQQKQLYLDRLELDFTTFEQLANTLQELNIVFRYALLNTLRTDLDKALQQNNVLSFDDLISRLTEALHGEKAQLLIDHLQQRFKVALIDEFQDTDHQQWQIFSQIFTATHQYLYLIGDPKQAIYKFRGADIYSYFAAQRQAQQHYTLLQNWRSDPDLVTAVNVLFNRDQPFLLPELDFNPVEAAQTKAKGSICDTPPLVWWQLDKNHGNTEYWTSGKAARAIRDAVVNEILQLLNLAYTEEANDTASDSIKIQAKDIAILVRSNNQALEYQQALQAVGIPAVVNSKQSVFATDQALEIYIVLQAVAQPSHIPTLKQALTLSWFNLDGQQLYQFANDETALDAYLSRFQQYHEIWQQSGLLSMMQRLLEQEQVEQQLCELPQAERILTNLHHIIERLQQVSIDEQLAINKTLDWLRQSIHQAPQQCSDDQQLRLESDADAVKIVTLHGSKGLEYAVVFCPSLWQRSDRLYSEKNQIQCHEEGHMIVDLGSAQFAERRQKAIYEELAEDLRLLYVAVTRAKYRCYLCWADVRTKEKPNDSALAYLLDFADTDFAGQQQMFKAFLTEHPEAFAYQLLPVDCEITEQYLKMDKHISLSYRHFQRSLYSPWQMSSYTALSALSIHDTPELPEDKALETSEGEVSDNGLPKGAITGNVVHYLLETLNFQMLASGNDISKYRDQAIARFGLQLQTPQLIDQLLQTVTTSALSEDVEFCLKNLHPKNCIKEMPFYLAMPALNVERINDILTSTATYQPLASKQMRGYLTGFIDLICCYQGKFYVIDYKTNSLPDYQPTTLLQAMREHNYGLQYWLYSLVLDAYLQQRLPGYDYQQHFGGIKYLFVRGMVADKPGYGVFTDLPEYSKLNALSKVLLPALD
ncbi:exodeoxyribonuclease V subunit beta [Methylomonas sp. AM2-LC]|uniref:exodeoxyribonuclease V subunit beta n=1 Tax=Methylomonas sp. AM2-LC TaxID=3153301 RepID=UPI003262F602